MGLYNRVVRQVFYSEKLGVLLIRISIKMGIYRGVNPADISQEKVLKNINKHKHTINNI